MNTYATSGRTLSAAYRSAQTSTTSRMRAAPSVPSDAWWSSEYTTTSVAPHAGSTAYGPMAATSGSTGSAVKAGKRLSNTATSNDGHGISVGAFGFRVG